MYCGIAPPTFVVFTAPSAASTTTSPHAARFGQRQGRIVRERDSSVLLVAGRVNAGSARVANIRSTTIPSCTPIAAASPGVSARGQAS
jgi:hypothetical protein